METTANTECDREWHHSLIIVGDLERGLAVKEKPMKYQLVGEVMAYQGEDA